MLRKEDFLKTNAFSLLYNDFWENSVVKFKGEYYQADNGYLKPLFVNDDFVDLTLEETLEWLSHRRSYGYGTHSETEYGLIRPPYGSEYRNLKELAGFLYRHYDLFEKEYKDVILILVSAYEKIKEDRGETDKSDFISMVDYAELVSAIMNGESIGFESGDEKDIEIHYYANEDAVTYYDTDYENGVFHSFVLTKGFILDEFDAMCKSNVLLESPEKLKNFFVSAINEGIFYNEHYYKL